MTVDRWKYLLPGFRRAAEREMQEELDALAALADRRELGNLTLAAEDARAVWGWPWLDGLGRDILYAFRVLRRQPGFTAVAVLSLALGICANAAIFRLIDALLWRDLPVRDPSRLVQLSGDSASYFAFRQFQENSGEVLSGVLATTGVLGRDLDTGGGSEAGQVELVSGNYFTELGVSPLLGRTLSPADDRRAGPSHAAVLSCRYWQRAYGGGRDALGRTIYIQKVPFTIVGVAPLEFLGLRIGDGADVWIPLFQQPAIFPGRNWLDNRNDNFLDLFGRLKPGIGIPQAAAVLSRRAQRIDIERGGPGMPDWIRKQIEAEQLDLQPAGKGVSALRYRFSEPLRTIFAMVVIALLLACVNVMGLQFARTDERRRELSVRLSIGAGRWRIVRQLLAESIVVAGCGAALGLALYRPAAVGLVSLISWNGSPVRLDLRIDSSLLLFVLVASIVAALICGVVPALRATRGPLAASLRQGDRAVTAARAHRTLGRAAVSVQLALSVVLVSGTFLFAFSLRNLTTFDTGIGRRNL
jgi:predicted permease